MELMDYVKKYNVLKSIKRFQMEVTQGPQDLCNHGYNVGTIFYLLSEELEIPLTSRELFLVMNHDFAEAFTGDLNKRIKDLNPETQSAWTNIEHYATPDHLRGYMDDAIESELGEEKAKLFNLADIMDAMLYSNREALRGNTFLIPIRDRYKEHFLVLAKDVGLSIMCHKVLNEMEGRT